MIIKETDLIKKGPKTRTKKPAKYIFRCYVMKFFIGNPELSPNWERMISLRDLFFRDFGLHVGDYSVRAIQHEIQQKGIFLSKSSIYDVLVNNKGHDKE